jgi:hypothetical protein
VHLRISRARAKLHPYDMEVPDLPPQIAKHETGPVRLQNLESPRGLIDEPIRDSMIASWGALCKEARIARGLKRAPRDPRVLYDATITMLE